MSSDRQAFLRRSTKMCLTCSSSHYLNLTDSCGQATYCWSSKAYEGQPLPMSSCHVLEATSVKTSPCILGVTSYPMTHVAALPRMHGWSSLRLPLGHGMMTLARVVLHRLWMISIGSLTHESVDQVVTGMNTLDTFGRSSEGKPVCLRTWLLHSSDPNVVKLIP